MEICGLIVFWSFDGEYIDLDVHFGSDYNTYTYQTFVYIAIALRWGISGILWGLGAHLQFSKTTTYRGITIE